MSLRANARSFETLASTCSRSGILLGALLGATLLPSSSSLRAQTGDDEVVAVVDAFHEALVAGDSTAALALLSDDVVILEGGGVETKDEYRSGHLAGDMRFAAAVPAERGSTHHGNFCCGLRLVLDASDVTGYHSHCGVVERYS